METEDTALERYGDRLFAHGNAGEPERLAVSAQIWDSLTIELLGKLRPAPDSRCLEAGAGLGTIASWLAGHCPEGRVVATDLNISLLQRHVSPGVEILRHDVVHEDFPAGSFDLIHARNLLCNLPERDDVLTKMASWLAPGGVILIEDPTLLLAGSSPDPLYRSVLSGCLTSARKAMGSEMNDWARSFPRPLQHLGLVDVGLHVHSTVTAKGTPVAEFVRTVVTAVAPRMVADGTATAAEIEEFCELLESPGFIDVALVTMAMWGSAPA